MTPDPLPFEYPFRWRNEDLAAGVGVSPEIASILEQRDRDLEDFLSTLGGGGGVPTFFVAAANATDRSKSYADYVCDGVTDDVEINAAFAAIGSSRGRVVLSEGDFYLSATVTLGYGKSLVGMLQGTYIETTATVGIDGVEGGEVRGIAMYGDYTISGGVGISIDGWDATIDRCELGHFETVVRVSAGSARPRVLDSIFFGIATTDLTADGYMGHFRGNHFRRPVVLTGEYDQFQANYFEYGASIQIGAGALVCVVAGNLILDGAAAVTNAGTGTNLGINFSPAGPF